MVQVEVMTLDNKEYIILKEIIEKNIGFVYLSNLDDPNDMMIRKCYMDNPNHYIPLESEEEYQLASLLLFQEN